MGSEKTPGLQAGGGYGTVGQQTNGLQLGSNEVVFGTDPDRNRVTWETPNSEAIPSVESHQAYAPPMRPGANAGMKRTSVVEHNLYFAGLAIVG